MGRIGCCRENIHGGEGHTYPCNTAFAKGTAAVYIHVVGWEWRGAAPTFVV